MAFCRWSFCSVLRLEQRMRGVWSLGEATGRWVVALFYLWNSKSTDLLGFDLLFLVFVDRVEYIRQSHGCGECIC